MAITEQKEGTAFLSDPVAIEEGLRLGNVGIWRWNVDGAELKRTRNLESVHRLQAGSFDGSIASFQRNIHSDEADGVWQGMVDGIETGKGFSTVYRTAAQADAASVWIETSGGVSVMPDGSRYLTGVCVDVSERVRNEQTLQRHLRQQSCVASFGSFALHEPDLNRVLDRAVRVAAEVLDVPLTKILRFADSADHLVLWSGVGWAEGLVGTGRVGIERSSQAGHTLLSSDPVVVRDLLTETRFDGPALLTDHGVRSGMSVIIPGAEERPFGVFGIHSREVRDFDQADTEFLLALAHIVAGAARQVAASERQRLLVREMAHRAGNLLQLVTSIARQTFNSTRDNPAAQLAFSERLGALAKSNYVVSRGGWTSTRFMELVEETLRPFGDRITIKGRDILLPADLCFDMGIVLHELATNSVKYGTLGKIDGTISVTWHSDTRPTEGRSFCFIWDDPSSRPSDPPTSAGFGSILVQALVERKWKGRIEISTEPHFRISFEIPLGSEGTRPM